ncbi:hypothetical protein LR48_Vigan01g225200 [Vigna angularis]|uniref:Uncharacterized protein n=1 Tax=Phaseolus angularis TaxID=3914 RepID=A0A0L9TQE1_PHAAN|nr:hypothetical protein LR48_Vigan01g225200 [Vigna angularis]
MMRVVMRVVSHASPCRECSLSGSFAVRAVWLMDVIPWISKEVKWWCHMLLDIIPWISKGGYMVVPYVIGRNSMIFKEKIHGGAQSWGFS